MTRPSLSAVFTDLDGTLLNSDRKVSEKNLQCLLELGKNNTVRVIATGRSLYSFQSVIPPDFPADYLIFSSGAGIIDLGTGDLLRSVQLDTTDISTITNALENHRADFMVHHTVPENHRFIYRQHSLHNEDFNRRINIYHEFAKDLSETGSYPKQAAQVIAVLPPDAKRFHEIKSGLNGYQVTRTTSPLDHTSIWMEIFPENVHKGSAAAWLCNQLHLDTRRTVGIGNDYNDLDLLNFTPHSYILENAPVELHPSYRLACSNDEDGFYNAIQHAISHH